MTEAPENNAPKAPLIPDLIPEWSRPVMASQLDRAPSVIRADKAECAALAQRLGLVSIQALSAKTGYALEGDGVAASGSLSAEITQSCVVTLEDFTSTISQPFSLYFTAEDEAGVAEDCAEALIIDHSDHDNMPLENGRFDIGEAVSQTLALALDPYPRGPHADAALKEKGILREGEEQESPFAALAALKK